MTIAPKHKPPRARRWLDSDELRWTVRDWAVKIGVKTPAIHFRPMTTKWASMSTRGRMTVDTSLISLPRDVGEFVVVHELVHLLAPNHGKLFKSFMYAYMPDWEQRRDRLAKHLVRQRPDGRQFERRAREKSEIVSRARAMSTSAKSQPAVAPVLRREIHHEPKVSPFGASR